MYYRRVLLFALPIILLFTFCDKNPSASQNVGSANTAPTASFTFNPASGTTETTFTFDASGCSDNEDPTSVLQVRWDWENDGTWDTNYSTIKTATYQYTSTGTYTVKLEVKDSGGMTNTTIEAVSIQLQNVVVTIPDSNFEALIRETLNKPSGDITNIDLATITKLEKFESNIADISGIEYCTNLETLALYNEDIEDIDFQIGDISAISNLIKLKEINFGSNLISDINALTNLTNLEFLDLWGNSIVDISAVAGLTKLKFL